MMRGVLFCALGFWLSRQYYITHDQAERKQRVDGIERRLKKFLKREGLSDKEANQVQQEIVKNGNNH